MKKEKLITAPGKKVSVEKKYKKLVKSGAVTLKKGIKTPVKKKKASVREKLNGLTAKQELFCRLYASDKEFFGSGVYSYAEAYRIDKKRMNWYKNAQAASSLLLSNIIICNRINELLESGGLNDMFVDKQLQFLIVQHEDRTNKLGAIKEYNKLKQRITEKIDHTTKGKELPTPILGGASNVSTNNSD